MSTGMSMSELVSGSTNIPDTIGHSQDVADTTASGRAGGDAELVSYVNRFYSTKRAERRPYEATWFLNAAMIRGLSETKWNPILNYLESRKTPAHRSRDSINIILPKVKAKLSKFLKSRAIPVVTPATSEHEDVLNAKATTKGLEYQWQRLSLEELYEEVLLETMQTGKSFWATYWDSKAVAQVKEPDSLIDKGQVLDVPLGDVGVDIMRAFELLVDDLGIMRLQKQPEIQRVKVRLAADVEVMFNLPKGSVEPEVRESELFQYQRQIARLGARAGISGGASLDRGAEDQPTHVVVKEHFTAPNARFPKGRYLVVVGDKLLHKADELPYNLYNTTSPYPFVEFADTLTAGQFWPTTMVEQLVPIQSQYNRLRQKVDEQLKLQMHPKMAVPKQASLHPDAYNSEAGEKFYYNFQPGMPPPDQWIIRPPAVAGDVWRMLDTLRQERDETTNLYPASLGASGATSGFDTNLLQEAADSVHAPDIRRNELALRDAAFKIRRLMKLGYDIPRLISILGRDRVPEAFEFHQEQIDEHANIIIDTGSALPSQKHARIEAILKLDERQVFGPPGDPSRNRKITRMLDLGSAAENTDLVGRDEDQARLENLSISRGEATEDPMPWEDHDIHYEIHTDLLKSSEIKQWPPEQRAGLVRHTILHVKWKNPQNALQLAAVFGMQDVVAEIQQTMMIQAQAVMPPAPTGPGGPPPQAAAPQPAPQAA